MIPSILKIVLFYNTFKLLGMRHMVEVQAEYPRQPKIIAHDDGILLLEAAIDANITFRLSPNSLLLVNNIDIMEKIRKYITPLENDEDEKDKEIDLQELQQNVESLEEDLKQWMKSLSMVNNDTQSVLQVRKLRRMLTRIRLLNGKLREIQRNLLEDECGEKGTVCENGGTCYDEYKNFHCDCPAGWTGKSCGQDVDECYSLANTKLGCQNNAKCINTPGSYRCICAKGFYGTHCRLRSNACLSSSSIDLCDHGICIPANNDKGYVCRCDAGWTKNNTLEINTSDACNIDIDECHESQNACHSECTNLPGSFKCGPCPVGYTGNGFDCYDINECAIDNGGCSLLPKVRCVNTEGSYVCGNCPFGWLGDGHTCTPIPSNSCDSEKICHPQAKCEYISEIATCTCPLGMFGHGFGPEGCHNNSISDPCAGHICQNNGTCLVNGRGTSCFCPDGYSGALCEISDGCHPNPCQNNGTCKPLINKKYRCSCLRGTTGRHCETIRFVCGFVIYRPEGTLHYPTMDEGSFYENNERCAWVIRTLPGKILNVTFSDFDLEVSNNCNHDWLQIHDGPSMATHLIGRFCGKSLPFNGTFLSSQEQLFFWFRSDNATTGKGFNMAWESKDYICGNMNISLEVNGNGILNSTGYPGKSAPNRRCEWQLKAPYGYRFVLRIFEVNLGKLTNCTGDRLEIYDGSIDNQLLLEKFCETTLPKPLRSSSNRVYIYFYVDNIGRDSSFQLHYEVESAVPHCGNMYTDSSGIIQAAIDQLVCQYLIKQPRGIQISLKFLKYRPHEVESCALQMLEIYDGPDDEHPLLLRHCSKTSPEVMVTSKSNYMFIRYRNILHHPDNEPEFVAKYSRACDFTYHEDNPRRVITPNYPQPYLDNINCKFTIIGPPDVVIIANITDFDISESTALLKADDDAVTSVIEESLTYVDFYLSKTTKRRFYTSTSPFNLISEQNVMTIVFHATKNQRHARGLQIEYTFEKLRCGGVYTENQTHFEHFAVVFHPADEPDKEEEEEILINNSCEWIIEAPLGKYIQLALYYEPIGPSIKNRPLYYEPIGANLLVYGNNDEAQKQDLLFNLTRFYQFNETFLYNSLTIRRPMTSQFLLRGDYSFLNSFENCGGEFTARWGIIKSPGWPRPYPANSTCIWLIKAPIGRNIELQVQNFTLESSCLGDTLEIRNGFTANSPLIGSYCGSAIPKHIISYANSLYIQFSSDNFMEGKGFHINWQQTSIGCGGTLTSFTGSIHSPIPHNSAADDTYTYLKGADAEAEEEEECNWKIIVAQGSTIELNIFSPNINIEQLCKHNILRIYDGPTTLSTPMSFNCTLDDRVNDYLKLYSSSNQVLVHFTMGRKLNQEYLQFILNYIGHCTGIIDRPQGIIESPNFPDFYPENQYCQWDIRGGLNNKIELHFSHLNLANENNPSCGYDYLEIVDMENEDVLKKEIVCTLPYKPFITSGNRLILKFVSDFSDNAAGFRAEFVRQNCGKHLYEDKGDIDSPSAPFSVGMDCEWYIEGQPGTRIHLDLKEFHLESESVECSENFLLIAETKNSTIPLLKECQIEKSFFWRFNSPSHLLYIHFRTNAKRTRKYFHASYNTEQLPCGGLYISNSGYITSPNYPKIYESEIKCVWRIAPMDYGIEIKFDKFEHRTESCNDTSLTVFSSFSEVKHKFCGNQTPPLLHIHPSNIKIVYVISNSSKAGGRFLLHYRKQCGGNLTDNTMGILLAKANEECIWNVNIPEGGHFLITIQRMDCFCQRSQSNGICENGLGFKENQFDDIDVGNFSSYYCEKPHTNLVFKVSKLSIFARNINFQAEFSLNQEFCGGTLTSLHGILTSPMYPASYPSDIECVWTIEARNGNSIQLITEFIDIADSEHCNQDFLEVRTSQVGPLIGVYCGENKPESILESLEMIYIKFRSVAGSTGNGFKLFWNYKYSNEIVEQTSGIIEAPPLPAARYEEQTFSWRIMVDRNKSISLKYHQYTGGLKVHDGYDSTALELEIQSDPSWTYTSSSNVLYLETDNTLLEYFSLQWNSTERNQGIDPDSDSDYDKECFHEYVLTSNEIKNISSPGYPFGYKNDLKCLWQFKSAHETEHIVLAIYEVQLEAYNDCAVDYIRISTSVYPQGPWHEVLRLCDEISNQTKKPIHVIHGTPHLRIEFITDATISNTGFTSKVYSICGSNLTDLVGFISPQMKWLSYEPRVCWWHIDVEKASYYINLELTYPLSASKYDAACNSYALIYDGVDEHAPLLGPGKICSNQKSRHLYLQSSTHHVTIKYNIGWSFTEPFNLWNLTYRAVSACNGQMKLTDEVNEINITTPNYPNVPHTNTDCHWLVSAPADHTIQIKFVDRFNLNYRHCDEEYVELFDGSTELSPSMGKYCKRPPVLHTSGNQLHIHYTTTIAEPRPGFRVSLSISRCGGTYTSSERGYITSKGYPAANAYPSYSQCDYYINMPSNMDISLKFKDLHIPYNPQRSNASDYIIISAVREAFDNIPPPYILYGNVTELPSYDIDSNRVKISFNTFAKVGGNYRGFKIEYEPMKMFRDCHYITFRPGVILQIKFPRQTLYNYRYCTWKVIAGKKQRIRLEFLNMQDLKDLNLAKPPIFKVYDNHYFTDEIISFDANTYNASTIIRSTHNLLMLQVSIPKSERSLPSVQFRYNFDELSPCPADILLEDLSGEIVLSDRQNDDFANHFYCRLKFYININESLILTINKFLVHRINNNTHFTSPLIIQDLRGPQNYRENITNLRVPLILSTIRTGFITISSNKNWHVQELHMKYQRYPCGGVKSIDTGLIIAYPQLPYLANKELTCVWTIESFSSYSSNTKPSLRGNFSFGDTCEKEFLEIYLGWLGQRKPYATLCRDNAEDFKPINLTYDYNRIMYKSLNYQPDGNNFNLMIDNIINCGSEFEVGRYSRKLEITKLLYTNNLSCVWDIRAKPGLYIKLRFEGRFFIEDSPNCTKDYLEVRRFYDNLWWPDVRFCGREVLREYNTTESHLKLFFYTDEAITGDGFTIDVMADCTVTFNVTNEVQSIQNTRMSNSFMPIDAYGGFLHRCQYTFLANQTNVLFSVRVHIDSAPYPHYYVNKCLWGKFFITKINEDNSEQSEKAYCMEDFEIRAYRYLRIRHRATISVPFTIEFSYETCGGNITQPRIIRSQRGEQKHNSYVHNMKCLWFIIAPDEHFIGVYFRYFDMEHGTDYVSIFAGHTSIFERENRLAELTGNLTLKSPTIMIDSNKATILAVSDETIAERGFEATIKFFRNCNERITLTEGNTPATLMRNFKINDTSDYLCHYRIRASEGFRVFVTIKRLQLNTNNGQCNYVNCTDTCNYLEIFDSAVVNQGRMGKFCATNLNAGNISLISSYEDIMIIFKASKLGQYNFEIMLSIEKSWCSSTTEYKLSSSEEYTLHFPSNGLTKYPASTYCKWHFKRGGRQKQQIQINYLRMQNISQVTGKCVDYLQLTTSSTPITLCGYLNNYTIPMLDPELDLIFSSDDSTEDKGFDLTLTPLHLCNEVYTSLNGWILYSRSISKECNNIIKVPAEYRLNIYADYILFNSGNCSSRHFRVLDYYSNETIWDDCQDAYRYQTFHTNSSAVRILINDLISSHLSYVASERTLPLGCGGKMSTGKGLFRNPFYNDRNYSNCTWEIQVPSNNRIKLYFEYFNMGLANNCQWDNVKIIEVMPNNVEKLTQTLCGDTVPSDYISESNYLIIIANKSPNFDGTGWSISYDITDIQ